MRSSSRTGSLFGLAVAVLVVVSLGVTADEASATATANFEFVDGTLVCTGADVGETATIGDVTYTKRNFTDVTHRITAANAEDSCTSGETVMARLTLSVGLGGKGFPSDFNANISHWDTSSVTDMSFMLDGASAFNRDIGGWNVSKVIDMSSMFAGASAFNQNIGGWNTSSVTDMRSMFLLALAFDQPIGGWNVSSVTDMRQMFFGAQAFDQPIGSWDVSNVTDMGRAFIAASAFNQPIGGWDVSKVIDMSSMFAETSAFDQPIGGWNVSNVTDMRQMFLFATAFDQPIGGWNVSNVTDMRQMFEGATAFDQPIGGWNVSNVTDMENMFFEASAFNRYLGGWNVSKVTDMSRMFKDASAFNQNLGRWTLGSNVTLHSMLDGSGLSVACYDATLIGWATLDPPVDNRALGADGLVRSAASDSARAVLVTDRGWTITGDTDGGTVDGPCGEPVVTSTPAPAPGPGLACLPAVLTAGDRVTCTVSGADAGIDILWRASYSPVFASAGVRIGADGTGTFSFIIPAAAMGEELRAELVEWMAPVLLGVVGGPVPSSVPAGEGPVGLLAAVAVAIAFLLPVWHMGSTTRRVRRGLPVA